MPNIPNKWRPTSLRGAINEIYSDLVGIHPDEKAIRLFDMWGKFDVCMLSAYITPDMDVLDFGGGIGRVAKPLSKYVKSVTVSDISPEMIEIGKTQYAPFIDNIKWVVNTNTLPFPDNTFDLAYSGLCLFHLFYESHDHQHWIRELCRVLKPNGILYFDLHNDTKLVPEDLPLKLVDVYRKYPRGGMDTQIFVYRKVLPDEGKQV